MAYLLKKEPEDFIVEEINNQLIIESNAQYSIFILKKKNISTIKAIEYIEERYNLRKKDVGFAGYKDKNAITTQYISIPKNKLKNNFEEDEISNEYFFIHLKKICTSKKEIYAGFLEKNKFSIIIREISKKVEYKKSVFVNYFGEQRFSENNQLIGKLLLMKKYNEALKLHISTENTNSRNYKNIILFKKANPTDIIGALQKINKHILKIYVQAYQSYLWNKCAEKIILKNIKTSQKEIPLIGYDTALQKIDTEIREIYMNILHEEGITKRDFMIRQIPEISLHGSERKLLMFPQNLEAINNTKNSIQLNFILERGSYATEVIRQIINETINTDGIYKNKK